MKRDSLRSMATKSAWAICVLLLLCLHAPAAVFFKPDIPDFYQGQKSEWSRKCFGVAFANCMYYWEQRGYTGLFHGTGSWYDKMYTTIDDIVSKPCYDFQGWFDDYITRYGHGSTEPYGKNLLVSEYRVAAADGKIHRYDLSGGKRTDTVTDYTSLLSLYTHELKRCQDVLLMLHVDGWNYHFVTGAGIDEDKREVWYADPLNTFGNSTTKYKSSDSVPVPESGKETTSGYYHSSVIKAADGRSFESGTYANKNAYIRRIYTVCPCVPEPSALIIWSLLGGLAVGAGWWRRRKAA